MLDIQELSEDVIKTVAYNLGYTDQDFQDAEIIEKIHLTISEMDKDEAFERYLYWHNIVGLADQISDAYECLDAAEASAEDEDYEDD